MTASARRVTVQQNVVPIIAKVGAERLLAQLDFMRARSEVESQLFFVFKVSLCAESSAAWWYSFVTVLWLQNTDGIFPNAAIAKKLGEVMGDGSKDISGKSDK